MKTFYGEALKDEDIPKNTSGGGNYRYKGTFTSVTEVAFNDTINSTLEDIHNLLLIKGKEYRRNNNPYHNFQIGAAMTGQTPERVLHGFLLKHLVSYYDMIHDIENNKNLKKEAVEEKLNDILVYFLIQKAQLLQRIDDEERGV